MKVQVINISKNKLPDYETSQSAGMDARADFSRVSPDKPLRIYGDAEMIYRGEYRNKSVLRLGPGARVLIPTGLLIALPEPRGSYRAECQVRPRSGSAIGDGITVLNTPGTVDSDYRNEVGIILINHGYKSVLINDGERIAQLVFNWVDSCEWEEVDSLNKTDRTGGFGHTGTK